MSDSVRPHRCSPPGSPVLGILQARTLEWVVPGIEGKTKTKTNKQKKTENRKPDSLKKNSLYIYIIIFNLKIIALKNFVVFCQTPTPT